MYCGSSTSFSSFSSEDNDLHSSQVLSWSEINLVRALLGFWISFTSLLEIIFTSSTIYDAAPLVSDEIVRKVAPVILKNTDLTVDVHEPDILLSIEVRERDCFYNANTMILVYGPREDGFTVQDGSCILENMFIAATALNIQSCWINQVDDLFATPKGAKLKKLLGLPEDARVVGTCVVGYNEEGKNPAPKTRKEDFVRIK